MLDSKSNVKNALQEESLVHRPTKFQLRMMCMNMDELRIIVEFFKQHYQKFRKGAHVLLERIEDFDAVNEVDDVESAGEDYPDNVAEYKGLNDYEGGGGSDSALISNTDLAKEHLVNLNENIQNQHFATDFEPKVVKYMLFIKAPPHFDESKNRKERIKLMKNVPDKESQLRDHIQKLLKEAETLRGLEMTINDLNSLTEIMSLIR